MRQSFIAFILLLLASELSLGTTLVGARYAGDSGLTLAPGQIIRLEATGLKTVLPADGRFLQAKSIPLPALLAGISVLVIQSAPSRQVSLAAPILSLEQVDACSDTATSSPDCIITFLTVQIPYGLSVLVAGPNPSTSIVISENGLPSAGFRVGVASDQFHVITSCDMAVASTCQAMVTHSDGSLVSSQSPAKPNEVLVIYAWGLGNTMPAVPTGALTPAPAPLVTIPGYTGVGVQLQFGPNTAPSRPARFDSMAAYLTPGQVGLYQVNVQLPATFPDLQQCDGAAVLSNLTINLRGLSSFDGAPICAAR